MGSKKDQAMTIAALEADLQEARQVAINNAQMRDTWEAKASNRFAALGKAEARLKESERALHEAKAQLRAIARKAENEKREKHLAELGEGIVRLGDTEVTVSKKNDGESWVTVEFEVDAEELVAVEGFLKSGAEPKWDPTAPSLAALSRFWANSFVIPQRFCVGQ